MQRVWSKDRSRLLASRVGMMVFVYFNSRMINRTLRSNDGEDFDAYLEWVEAHEEELAAQAAAVAALDAPAQAQA